MMHWPNIAMGLSCDGVESGGVGRLCCRQLRNDQHRHVGTQAGRHPALRDCAVQRGAVIAAVSLVMFFAAGQRYEIPPSEYLNQNLSSSWLLLLLLYVPLALTLTLVSWVGMRSSSRWAVRQWVSLSRRPVVS